MIGKETLSRWQTAAPFAMSFLLVPLMWVGAVNGGWWLALVPVVTWNTYTTLDTILGLDLDNADPDTEDQHLFWYRFITWAWVPLQVVSLFGLIWYTTHAAHLGTGEKIAVFFGVGVVTGTIGINYAHELMHQKPRFERALADLLLAMVLYCHFRSEHMLVHHRYVGTPRDPVTARYNEGFHRFFARILVQCPKSAFKAEATKLARAGRSAWHPSNPFWSFAALQLGMLGLAYALGGWTGVGLFLFQAFIAVWQLELVNYVEHYGLTRKHLGDGRYDFVKPMHSWNAAHKGSNWLLINLQRHSDHHYKPDRRFPLLQNHGEADAPQLPYGYPIMTAAAMVPPIWRRMMNPRVRGWRKRHYPEIEDWTVYNKMALPLPR